MSLARAVTTVGTGTLLSRLLGFFRDVSNQKNTGMLSSDD
jgi:peptidoglycan biosynthesis protein MviN/MurJ (putative lipid II flippase)